MSVYPPDGETVLAWDATNADEPYMFARRWGGRWECYVAGEWMETRVSGFITIPPGTRQGVSMPRHSTDASRDALRTQHSHRVPNEAAQATLRDLRQRFLDLAVAVDDLLPPSRERSLALTNLDQARQWACNAAVSGGEIRETLTINIPA